MLRTFNISEAIRPRLEEVEQKVTDAYRHGTIETEERISGYLSGLLADKLDSRFRSGSNEIRIEVGSFEARDEPESGVDIGLRYQLISEEFSLSTGLLVQSKRFGKTDYRLPIQCYKMLIRTQEAYIFTYAEDEIGVVPALPVYRDGGTGGKFSRYYRSGFVPFLSRFLEGFYGDALIAGNVDQPAEAFPIPERVRYLVDIQTSIDMEEAEFSMVDTDSYRRIWSDEQY